MKILTLNLHCFAEDLIKEKQMQITNSIIDEDIDVVFFQEVAQGRNSKTICDDIKEDNYAHVVKTLLHDRGYNYNIHFKIGNLSFGKYDEGLAILSKTPLFDCNHFFISKKIDYNDWSTRIIVNAKTKYKNKTLSLTSAHLGWSNGFEVFENQFDKLLDNLDNKDTNIVAGDFNVKSGSKEYNYVIDKGYIDLFYNEEMEFFTTPTHIDDMDVQLGSNRIDYVMSNKEFNLISRKILFSEIRVSDHYGVVVEIEI